MLALAWLLALVCSIPQIFMYWLKTYPQMEHRKCTRSGFFEENNPDHMAVVVRYGPLFNFSKNRSNKYGHLGNFSHSSNDFWDDQQLRSHPKSNFCKMPDDQMTYLPDHTSHLAIARNEWMLFKITEHEYLVTSGHLGYLSHLDDLSHNDHLSNFGHLGHFDAMSHLGSFK